MIDSLRGGHAEDENSSKIFYILKSLAEIAERTKAAIIVIHHPKKPLFEGDELTANSSRGSNAIVAMFRSMLGVTHPDPKSDWCRLCMLKENLGIKPKPVGYLVTDTGIEIGEPPQKAKRVSALSEAADWLADLLASGKPRLVSEIEEEAGEVGHSMMTIRKVVREGKLAVKTEILRAGGKITGAKWSLQKGTR